MNNLLTNQKTVLWIAFYNDLWYNEFNRFTIKLIELPYGNEISIRDFVLSLNILAVYPDTTEKVAKILEEDI